MVIGFSYVFSTKSRSAFVVASAYELCTTCIESVAAVLVEKEMQIRTGM